MRLIEILAQAFNCDLQAKILKHPRTKSTRQPPNLLQTVRCQPKQFTRSMPRPLRIRPILHRPQTHRHRRQVLSKLIMQISRQPIPLGFLGRKEPPQQLTALLKHAP